jgi:hypothetical protein
MSRVTREADRRSEIGEILGKKLSTALESFGGDPDSLTIEALHMLIKLEDAGNKLEYSRVEEDEEDIDYDLREILREAGLGYFTDIGVRPEHVTKESYDYSRAILDYLMDEEKEYLTESGGVYGVKVGLILEPVAFVFGYREKGDEAGSSSE